MKSGKLLNLFVFVLLILGLVPGAAIAMPAEPQATPAPAAPARPAPDLTPQLGVAPTPAAGVDSLSGSNVTFNPAAGGDTCSIPGATQTFCFDAHSYTVDWEYVYDVWVKFPADWTVTNVAVQGTPVCTGGGTWGTLSWSFETSPNEINIYHPRYQAYTDDCLATYCVTVVSGVGVPGSNQSWYWDGDGYNAVPHHPCSSDNYTPPSMAAEPCDQAVNPQAQIPACAVDPGVYLMPESQDGAGCNGEAHDFTVSLYNHTGSAGTFNMSYSVPTANGTLTGPATVAAGVDAVVPFVVSLTPDLCAIMGDVVTGQVDATGNGYSDSALVNETVATGGGWVTVPASRPSWGGTGYVSDGCTAVNAAGDNVTYLIGDTSGTGPVGFWGYNHDTNTWFQPGAANTPADRWAPDWGYDAETNLCYLTGGASAPGAGTYNEAYVYNPVANAFAALPSFTSVRDFHDSWVGVVDGVKYLCIGGGNNGAGMTSTQCFDIAAGAWAAENATIGAYPTDIWGAADGVLEAVTGDQFWTVAGAQTSSMIADAAYYFDDADNLWHSAGNTGLARYRVEGDFWNGSFYQVAGSDGTFTGTKGVRRAVNMGASWTWEAYPDVPNQRMDNVATIVDGTLWSIEGYGSTANDYVDYVQTCPMCDLQGWLEGTVLDGDTQPLAKDKGIDSLSGSYVAFDPSVGGDTCYTTGTPGTFCFIAESWTNDYEYRYEEWLKFPDDWNVSNAYLVGTPVCDNGYWGTFSWFYETEPYEIDIYHPAYQQTTDHCVAYYCVDATPGGEGDVSWYYDGDGYASAPHHPCSDDQYTPASMSTEPCDEWVNPQADVPSCGVGNLGPTCQNATVTINPGNIHVAVDPATGHYGPVMLIQGEYTVEATAAGFTSETAVVAIVDEETTVQDFVLYRPVIDVTPLSMSVSAPPNTPVVIPMTISNNGHVPLDFEILEIPAKSNGATRVATTRVPVPAVAADKFDAALAQQLTAGPSDFFVWMSEKADLGAADALQTKAEKGQFVYNALTTVAERTQKDLRASLDQRGVEYKAFYIANKILVKGGSQALALDIAARSDVAKLTPNNTFQLQEPFKSSGPAQPEAVEPNISFVFADDVWAMGVTGEGIVLAGNDTGLDETVSTVARHYRGCLNPPTCTTWNHNYNWWDATGTYPSDPYDGFGHGTHTTGTMVGDDGGTNQIGMAPGAQTIHCKNMTDSGSGDDGTFTECFQWDLAPWDLTGANPDPSKAPDAVNNSWGYWGGNQPQFEDEIAALQAAGILVEVSAGNEGPSCTTLRSPGDYVDVLTTGSVDHTGTFPGTITNASWSPSRGPSLLYPDDYFPDIMAPGNNIRSQLPGGTFEYWGGTSMAGPHATGLIALMWSAAPGLRGQVAETINIIRQTAGPLSGQMGSNCGGDYTTGPNNDWGFGTINAVAAVEAAMAGGDMSWVTEEPVSGTIPALTDQPVVVTFECTPEQNGFILTGLLKINHNDPCVDDIIIPIDMTCGTPTDADIDVQPPALSDELISGETSTQQIDIQNLGTMPLDWTIIEHNPGAALPKPEVTPPAAGKPVELKLDAVGGPSVETTPPPSLAPVQLVLDDGSRENDIGIGGTLEFLWVNRFTPAPTDFPFMLNQVQFYFSSVGLVNVGDDINIVVYENTTGNTDPAVGSNFLASFPATVQALDTWNVYDLATPVLLSGPGDVIVGAIGLEVPGTSYWPASIDQTATQQRSWAGWWTVSPPPNPPTLPPDADWTLIDAYFPGNWMVRGYGETMPVPPECEPADIPWASVDPTSGTTEGHSGFLVDVTFDATGLAAGTYTANLCVSSNDPDEPFVTVPLELTVLDIQDIEVTPSSLAQELCPDETAVQPLTICNNGDVPLTWSLSELEAPKSPFSIPAATRGPAGNEPSSIGRAPSTGAPSPVQPIPADLAGILGTQAYAIDVYPGYNLISFDTDVPGTFNIIAGLPGSNYFGGDFLSGDTSKMYVVDYYLNQLHTVDTATGAVTVIGAAVPGGGESWTGLSGAPDGTLYGSATTCSASTLYTVDPATGATTPIGTVTNAPCLIDIAVTSDGTMYGIDIIADNLVQIDPATGAGTIIGYVGVNANYAQGMDYDPETGTMFWASYSTSGELRVIDLTTGASTLIGGFAGGAEVDCLSFPSLPPVDILWLSEDPLGGTIPADSCVTVDVTFDSTGLVPGDYFAGLLIESNDPDTPEVIVPVQLTVTDCECVVPFDAEFTVDPASPFVGDIVTFDGTVGGGQEPLTWEWDFDDGTTGTGQSVTHVYTEAGTYTVLLTVSNECGSTTFELDVVVQEVEESYFVYLPIVQKGYGPNR